MHAINHCELTRQINGEMQDGDFQEAVMARAGEIISGAQTGKTGTVHKFPGVELVAQSVARHVVDEGARMVANDLGVNIEGLKRQAASSHISSC